MGSILEHDPLRPKLTRAESKADITDRTARTIIGAEAQSREAKTARLRQARLEKEAAQPAIPAPGEVRRRKAPARRIRFSA